MGTESPARTGQTSAKGNSAPPGDQPGAEPHNVARASRRGIGATIALSLRALHAAALLSLASVAGAADVTVAPPDLVDSNGDGKITFDEYVHGAAKMAMGSLDADKNGVLTPSEVPPSNAQTGAGVPRINLRDADTNSDGVVDADELEQALKLNPEVNQQYRNLDANGDGVLNGSELGGVSAPPQIRLEF
jgi:hypothetical protein